MNFQMQRNKEELEINLIPMIDVLLVILIFLMITTTYSKFSGMQINLPTADATTPAKQSNELTVQVSADGQVQVNKTLVNSAEIADITNALKEAQGSSQAGEIVVIINADAKATHQSVIDVMQAAQNAGLSRLSFSTRKSQ